MEFRGIRFWMTALILVVGGLVSTASSAFAVPVWSRRYSTPCSTCHSYPSLQLTAMGLDFFRRGHRFEKDEFDKDFTHWISAHVEWETDIQQGQPTTFSRPDFHLHAGGAFSSIFSAYLDAKVNDEFETIYLQATKSYGEEAYITFRGGKASPTILRNYTIGLLASVSSPLIISDATLGNNPFTPARDSFGMSVAGKWKMLFVEGGVLNGEDVEGQAAVGSHKDLYATVELTVPESVSGVGLYLYRGGYDLGDQDAGFTFDRYNRVGIFSNFTRDRFRVAGAYLRGTDSIRGFPNKKIDGYYGQFDLRAYDWLVPFVRYEGVNAQAEDGTDRIRRGTFGASALLFERGSAAGRLVIEGFRQAEGSERLNGALMNWIVAF